MLTSRTIKLAIAVITATGTSAGLGTLTSASASAATSAPAHAAAPAAVARPMTPTTNRCTNGTHTTPCWAKTVRATTLTTTNGATYPIGGNDLVEIQCYYTVGATFYDHVIKEDAGSRSLVGHINDNDIDLGGRRPNSSYIHLPQCG